METLAVVMNQPGSLELQRLALDAANEGDLVVATEWSGISTGTERLLWSGRMPPFPGLGYPLVPGYETVGRVIASSGAGQALEGRRVFVPGARCFGAVRGLFGGAASRLVVPADRVVPLPEGLGEQGVLLALAATAHHALALDGAAEAPDLVVGHGVLGRLIARIAVAAGGSPTVWETSPERRDGAVGYEVIDPSDAPARPAYRRIVDVSGDASIIDRLIGAAAPRGTIILAGFYSERVGFEFPAAFMKEISLRIAAEWQRPDLETVVGWIEEQRLSLDGLITHRVPVEAGTQPDAAYRTAFGDPSCLKMVLDWRRTQ